MSSIITNPFLITLMICISIGIFIFFWFIHAIKTCKLSMDCIKPNGIYEPLKSSPFIKDGILATIRCLIGFISIIVLLYDILYINHSSSDPSSSSSFYSYYIWSWLLLIIYFLSVSFATFCHCLSGKSNISQNSLRIIIWIIYQIELSLSLTLIIFLWLYLMIISPSNNPLKQHLIHFPDITMVSCNFLFIWSDFFVNDICLNFNYGIFIVFIAWIYSFFVLLLYGEHNNIIIYSFLDPSKPINSIFYILWIIIHFILWIIVYFIAYIKMKYQKRLQFHAQKDDDELTKRQSVVHHIPSATITIDPDGTINSSVASKYKSDDISQYAGLSDPDLMIPNYTIDEDDIDELSPLAKINFNDIASEHTNHSVLTARFIDMTHFMAELENNKHNNDDDDEDSISINTEYNDKDDEVKDENGNYLPIPSGESMKVLRDSIFSRNSQRKATMSSRNRTISSLTVHKSFHERVNSVTV